MVDFPGFRQHELVECKVAQRQRQHHQDGAVQLLAGVRSNGLAAVDVALALQAPRGKLKHPGKNECRNEADGEQNDRVADGAIAPTKQREQGCRHLYQQPRHHEVRGSDTEHVAALEFGE